MRAIGFVLSVALVLVAPVALVVARSMEVRATTNISAAGAHPLVSSNEYPAKDPPMGRGGVSFLGVILPRETTDVAPPVSGRLLRVNVRIGDRVHANDVLATLDARLTAAELLGAQAAANAQSVEYEIALAASQAMAVQEQRVLALAAEGLASQEDGANARKERKLASLRVDAAQESIAQKNAQVSRLAQERDLMEIRAPFDGTIVARYVDPGATVSLNPLKPIVRLISADRLFLRFAIPEDRTGELREGSRIRATTDAGEVIATGRIEKIAPEVDTASHAAFAEASIDEAVGEALSGLVAHVTPLPMEP